MTWRNINYWAYGLLHTNVDTPVPDFEEVRQAPERSLDKVAVMNLKKLYGGSEVNNTELECFAESDQKLILEQINEINPDIIVTCSNMYLLKKYIIPEEELFKIDIDDCLDSSIKSKHWVNIWKLQGKNTQVPKDVLIIRHYHPAATTSENQGFEEKEKYDICCKIKQGYLKSIKE